MKSEKTSKKSDSIINDIKAVVVVFAFSMAFIIGGVLPFVAHAANTPPVPSSISITTISDVTGNHSAPFSFACPANPLYSPVTISGSGVLGSNPPGQVSAYKVQVTWPDGTVQNGVVPTLTTGANNPFTFVAGPHTITANVTGSIKVRIYHQTPPGQDNQADSVATVITCVAVPPSNNGQLLITKNVINDNGGVKNPGDFTMTVTNANPSLASFPGSSATTTVTVAAGSYDVSEIADAGYTATRSADCSGTIAAGETKICHIVNNDNIPTPVLGCTDPAANNYNSHATANDGSCTYTVLGCTDSTANNYNPVANKDDNSCTYTVPGCTDEAANNYNPEANQNDGSCTYNPTPVLGCMDPHAYNYSVAATQDDGSCAYDVLGCTDPAANNFNADATLNDGSCTYTVLGCTDSTANNFNPAANTSDNSCTYNPTPVLGCMDSTATNYNPAATQSDNSCTYAHAIVLGCMNPSATNYNADATQDDGSCTLPSNGGGNSGDNGGGNTTSPPAPPTPSTGGNGPIAGSLGGGGSIFGGGQVLGASTSTLPELPNGCSALLNTYMRLGKKNDTAEVKKLQKFLNDELKTSLPINGIFGKQTDAAVRKFQAANVPQVLTPWGITDPTGYVYKTTQRWINLTYCSTLNIPMPELN